MRLALAALLTLAACDSPGDVREWTPRDHEGEQRAPGQVAGSAEVEEDATLVEVTWRQSCAVCHGLDGRSDTQQGQLLHAPDLTRPELARVDDATLAATIQRGRNKMPAFDLPDKVVLGLVRHVRRLGGRK